MILFPHETPLHDLLRLDFRQFGYFGLAAMHQSYRTLGNIEKCREIQDWVDSHAEIKSRIKALRFYKTI